MIIFNIIKNPQKYNSGQAYYFKNYILTLKEQRWEIKAFLEKISLKKLSLSQGSNLIKTVVN